MGWATVPPARGDLGGRGLTITPSLEEDIPDLLQNIPGTNYVSSDEFEFEFLEDFPSKFLDVKKLEFLRQEIMIVNVLCHIFICI